MPGETDRYEELRDFLQNRMQMSHIYQPVMLMTLLGSGGRCHEKEIASALLSQDPTQVEYYTKVTNNMVGRVLRRHGLVTRDRTTKVYSLVGYETLTSDQRHALASLCEKRLRDFVTKRGEQVFAHRRKSVGYISGTLKYEVLKRARFRCELCGISADQKALEADHIIPRNKGGSDDSCNLQALCYSCNAMKRDRDDTDFRRIRDSYEDRADGCLFCEVDESRKIGENALAYMIRDGYPVTNLHTLVIPKRHVGSYFELGQAEMNACTALLQAERTDIESRDTTVSGFNIGVNNGETAGQTVPHCHIHLIPRRAGDVEKPRGGVRHVIPGKGAY